MWELVPGTNDIVGHKFSANVTILGGYMLSALPPGKAGW